MQFTLEILRKVARAIIDDVINEFDSNARSIVTNTEVGKFVTQFADNIGSTGGKADVYLFGKLIRTVKLSDSSDIHNPEWRMREQSSMTKGIIKILFHCMWEAQYINTTIENLWKQGNASVELLNGLRLSSEVIHRPGGDRCFTLADKEGSLFSTSLYSARINDLIGQIHHRWIPPGLYSNQTHKFEFDPAWEKHVNNFLLEIIP